MITFIVSILIIKYYDDAHNVNYPDMGNFASNDNYYDGKSDHTFIDKSDEGVMNTMLITLINIYALLEITMFLRSEIMLIVQLTTLILRTKLIIQIKLAILVKSAIMPTY